MTDEDAAELRTRIAKAIHKTWCGCTDGQPSANDFTSADAALPAIIQAQTPRKDPVIAAVDAVREIRARAYGRNWAGQRMGDSDDPGCAKCGHRAVYHGMTFCTLESGSYAKRFCDCDGWVAQLWTPRENSA